MTINKASDLAVFENVEIITRKNKKRKALYIGCVEVTLPNTQIQANLIVIRGNSSEQMLLLTNLHVSRNLIQIIREIYLDRWRIEEYFRLKKQQFNLEKMYVRTLNAMRTLNIIVNIVIGTMCLISEKYKKSNETFVVYKTLVNRAKPIKNEKKVKLYLYRLSSGLSEILSKLQKRLIDYFIPKIDKNIIFGQLMLC